MGKKRKLSSAFLFEKHQKFYFLRTLPHSYMCPHKKDIPRMCNERLLMHKIVQSNSRCKGNLIHEYGGKFKSSIIEASIASGFWYQNWESSQPSFGDFQRPFQEKEADKWWHSQCIFEKQWDLSDFHTPLWLLKQGLAPATTALFTDSLSLVKTQNC